MMYRIMRKTRKYSYMENIQPLQLRRSCFANVILQYAFHCVRIRQQILKNKVSNALTDAVCAYAEYKCCNILADRRFIEERTTRCFGIFNGSNDDVFQNQCIRTRIEARNILFKYQM